MSGGWTSRLVHDATRLLERRTSRRGFLVRTATVGSALVVAPLRFLLRPQSALASIVRPRDCAAGRCTDGWTEFCCTINDGVNMCPPYAFVGGRWKCTDYRGRRLCADSGVRYYIDCNRRPGRAVPGGCHCAGGDCGHFRIGCNVFRYGQCNLDIHELTEVVCRVVVCEHPASIPEFNCNATYKQDNRTCVHDAPCLTPGAGAKEFVW
jgi:hypothetical protein